MKKNLKRLALGIPLLLLVSILALYVWDKYLLPDAISSSPVSQEFNSPDDLISWDKFVDVAGYPVRPPNPAAERVIDGQLILEVSPDPNFDNESSQQSAGMAAPPQYNNAFALGMKGFSPTHDQQIVVEWKMQVISAYKGTTGLWLEDQHTFDKNGYFINSSGFPGAFGLSWTSKESIKEINGLKFTYVKGFIPLCILNVTETVDPTQWNTYRIQWRKGGEFSAYVNGAKVGSCFIPVITFHVGELQLWADNYKIDPGFVQNFQNPTQKQSTSFDWIHMWSEPVQ